MILAETARFHAASYHYVSTFPGGMDAMKKELPLITAGGTLGQFMTRDKEVRWGSKVVVGKQSGGGESNETITWILKRELQT